MRKSRISGSLALFAAATLTVGLSAGCASSMRTPPGQGFWHYWGTNIAEHYQVVVRDLVEIHRSVDRHLFNYDWDDPYL